MMFMLHGEHRKAPALGCAGAFSLRFAGQLVLGVFVVLFGRRISRPVFSRNSLILIDTSALLISLSTSWRALWPACADMNLATGHRIVTGRPFGWVFDCLVGRGFLYAHRGVPFLGHEALDPPPVGGRLSKLPEHSKETLCRK